MASLYQKKDAALGLLAECGSAVVALSGGVDSALLLTLAVEALGPDRLLAATGRSASLAATELEDARRVARRLGVRHETPLTRELSRPEYRANRGNRCFFCREELFSILARLARERGLGCVVYGAIADDLGEHRPGMRAAERRGVRAPLLEAGLGKSEVRALARAAGLSVASKPASPCLASRIPVGTEVTRSRLATIERAEAALRRLGFRIFRVRHHGTAARLELDPAGLALVADPGTRDRVCRAVADAGFGAVSIDPLGYRGGGVSRPIRPGGQ